MGSYDNGNFPSMGYLDPSDVNAKNIEQFKSHFYQSNYPQNSVYWQQGVMDTRFKAGDQSLWSMLYGDRSFYQARRFFFNLIRKHINLTCGYQRRNRKSTIAIPTLDTDPLADDFNACIKWSENRDGFQEYFSQMFEGGATAGFGMLHMYPDYTFDPISGDLFTDYVSFQNVLMDSYWRKLDLSDCCGIWRRRWVDMTQAKALLPGRAKELQKIPATGVKDGRFPLQAELLNLDMNRLFCYDEFHYRTTRLAEMVIDPKSGEAVEWETFKDDENNEFLMKQVLRQQPWLIVKKVQVPTVNLCISIGNKTFYDGQNLLGIDTYPMVVFPFYHEPDLQAYAWRLQGMVRNMRDAQYLYNRRKIIELQILESQINSGWIYPVDAVVDDQCFRQSGAGFLIPLKAGKTPAEIQRIDAPSIPQSMIELSRALASDLPEISGVSEELLGTATDDKAGILALARSSGSLTTLQSVFDRADYVQRLYGKIRLEAIRKNFSRGKVRSILGKDPDPRFFTASSLKYDVIVEQGNYSTSQRQMELQQLLYFRENLQMPIPDKSIIDAAFLTNKAKIKQDMEQQSQQQAQMQQQQAQMQAQKDQAEIMSKYAKARGDIAAEKDKLASAEERLAKINELQSSSEHKKAQADMDLVKMMIELEDMDMANFRASFEMAEAIKMRNNPQLSQPVQI